MLTVQTQLIDRMLLIFGEWHLRILRAQYLCHYNGRRPHPRARPSTATGRSFERRYPTAQTTHQSVLGGLMHEINRSGRMTRGWCLQSQQGRSAGFGALRLKAFSPWFGTPKQAPLSATCAERLLTRPVRTRWSAHQDRSMGDVFIVEIRGGVGRPWRAKVAGSVGSSAVVVANMLGERCM